MFFCGWEFLELNSPSMFFLVGCNGLEGGWFWKWGIRERLDHHFPVSNTVRVRVFVLTTPWFCPYVYTYIYIYTYIHIYIYMYVSICKYIHIFNIFLPIKTQSREMWCHHPSILENRCCFFTRFFSPFIPYLGKIQHAISGACCMFTFSMSRSGGAVKVWMAPTIHVSLAWCRPKEPKPSISLPAEDVGPVEEAGEKWESTTFFFDLELYDSFWLDLFSTPLGKMFLSKHNRSFGKGTWHVWKSVFQLEDLT